MKTIKEILDVIKPIEIKGTINNDRINKIFINSTEVKHNSLFIAIKGNNQDGHNYIDDAIKNGAKFILCENFPSNTMSDVLYIRVNNTQKIAGEVAAAYYDYPSKKLKVVGVTGTNGKTTIATLLYRLARLMGKKAGLFSTIINYVDSKLYRTTNTTPNPVEIQRLMNKMVEAKCTHCFMEVSSHAIVQHRINGIHFTGGIFTNLSHDHLDYHKTFDAYLKAKKTFFDNLPESAFALTNIDDKNGKIMVQNTKAKIYTYGLKNFADFNAKILEKHIDSTLIKIKQKELWTKLIGTHNVYNILAIYACSVLLGFNEDLILSNISLLDPVDGRLELIKSNNGINIFIDYAHTPDALFNVLKTLNDIKKENSKIIVVVGAGGNRDKTKRPEMAKVSAEMSSTLILTSDNPRNEKPEDIINDMKSGLDEKLSEKTLVIIDRKEAIKTAIKLAQKDDIILIAGKGHETYQEINGIKYYFNDKEVVKNFIREI
ncbi:MAG: UDP-N-acetylmuramoyl-L-alanyl-D-glutamate--2,6-diaminopimelate ligase [Bacteroidales bacterium]|nr:UDP-N-acetylmuramoyl-L-alanyl-D-glutamate--2,6-diaminopimelate ligase [Bacteroidales bacterium]